MKNEKVEYKGVCIYAEHSNQVMEEVVFELLSKGRELAIERNCKVSAIVIGNDLNGLCNGLIDHGADIVYRMDHKEFDKLNDLAHCDVLTNVILKYRPEIVLFGATPYGISIAARLASRLNTGLTSGCTQLSIDPMSGCLLQTRPAFGGSLFATIICKSTRPQMATVRPGIMKKNFFMNKGCEGKILDLSNVCKGNPTPGYEIIDQLANQKRECKLSNAEIVFGIGMGVKTRENIKRIKTLAQRVGAAVGATRDLIETGYLDADLQIGHTGQIIHPNIYVAFGISGAVQHMAGVTASEGIIAINKDAAAPIFKYAKWGIVEDAEVLLTKLLEREE